MNNAPFWPCYYGNLSQNAPGTLLLREHTLTYTHAHTQGQCFFYIFYIYKMPINLLNEGLYKRSRSPCNHTSKVALGKAAQINTYSTGTAREICYLNSVLKVGYQYVLKNSIHCIGYTHHHSYGTCTGSYNDIMCLNNEPSV